MIKLVSWFDMIRERILMNRCYSYAERIGMAVFGMCEGCPGWGVCQRCPYKVTIERAEIER